MSKAAAQANAAKSSIRAHVFAHQKNRFNLSIRTIGLARPEAILTLCNLAYNFNCLIYHERRETMGSLCSQVGRNGEINAGHPGNRSERCPWCAAQPRRHQASQQSPRCCGSPAHVGKQPFSQVIAATHLKSFKLS
ncbi:hypothetical protein [Sphingobium sp. AP50]|uniref:hypothetical protein n=1 Tax=Sphingobium sp. AP50 TaxID=1884369 RepID=UPI001C431788|nr:hypothetical protein [Sphingobium sp. AP50]